MLLTLITSLFSTACAGDTLIVARGVAEAWGDPAIGSVYRTGALMGAVGVVVPIAGPISIDVEAAYRRMDARIGDGDHVFQLLPITLLGEFTFPAKEVPIDPFVGLGFAMASFSERHPANADGLTITRGARPSLELRAGIRLDLGLVHPPMPPARSVVQRVDLEVFGARRAQRPGAAGFDLAAWRGGLGLAIAL